MKTGWMIMAIGLAQSINGFERLEPASRCYFGMTVASGVTVEDLRARLGITPAVYVNFYGFPLSDSAKKAAAALLEQVSAVHGIAMLTLEPWAGLEALSQRDYEQAANLCAFGENLGITGYFIRFGHEMNGNWYAWGQQSVLFKESFRLFANEIHARTKRTAMVWSPNYGVGYPFGNARPARGSADFEALDTNGDGRISEKDDMYEPYYPGDDVVDWVGMTLYHWGVDYPWLENELPPKDSFARSLTGKHQGSTPNFYEQYCVGHGKPMAIPETAAFYNTERSGPDELSIKRGWWQQVLAAAPKFPKLKCINWFDEYKRESVAQNNLIDWRISADPRIRSAFVSDLRAPGEGRPYFMVAEEARWAAEPDCVTNIRRTGQGVTIDWAGKPSEQYLVYGSSNGKTWFPASGLMQGRGEQIFWTVPVSAVRGAMIFRVQVRKAAQ